MQNHIKASAREAFDLARRVDAKLTAAARRSWRWRILYLRAQIDKELFERKGKLGGKVLDAAFQELSRIYQPISASPAQNQPAVK